MDSTKTPAYNTIRRLESADSDIHDYPATSGSRETSPLLPKSEDPPWMKPPYFLLIETALFANVFLAGFDGTVTASTYGVIGSSFHGSNLASWITTSYLVTSTALQPLYGRFSDLFGRRICLLLASASFGIGCLGCAISPDLVTLNLMRALTGVGGGGLMTMATIINSDLIPTKQRGMYQALQNILHGFGAISGASLGGVLADAVGWRFCFLIQVPVVAAAFLTAFAVVSSEACSASQTRCLKVCISDSSVLNDEMAAQDEKRSLWSQIDITGATLLFCGLSLQLAAMSIGSNSLNWTDPAVLGCFAVSCVLLGAFVVVEYRTKAIPVMPLSMLASPEKAALLIANICLGLGAYGILFLMPLFFQSVLLDSASVAGLRLVPPSIATPLGGLTTGLVMRRAGCCLTTLTRAGLAILVIGGCLTLSFGQHDPLWKYSAFLAVGNYGAGMVYPSVLFSFIRASDFEDHAVATSLVYLTRSMGTVWGVAAVSTITQSVLSAKLPEAFSGIPGGEEAVDLLKHSVEALHDLPPDLLEAAQRVYNDACRDGFFFLLCVTGVALVCSLVVPVRKRQGQ